VSTARQPGLFTGVHLLFNQVERALLSGDIAAARTALHGHGGPSVLPVRSMMDILDVATGGDWAAGLPDPRAWHRAWIEALREPESHGAERGLPAASWSRAYCTGAATRLEAAPGVRLRGLGAPAWWLLSSRPEEAVRSAWERCTSSTSTSDLCEAAWVAEAAGAPDRGLWLAALLRKPSADPRAPPPLLDPTGHPMLDRAPAWVQPWPTDFLDAWERAGSRVPPGWVPAFSLADGSIAEGAFLDPRVLDAAHLPLSERDGVPPRDALRTLLAWPQADRPAVLASLLGPGGQPG
jgi:hypothetical protein